MSSVKRVRKGVPSLNVQTGTVPVIKILKENRSHDPVPRSRQRTTMYDLCEPEPGTRLKYTSDKKNTVVYEGRGNERHTEFCR